MMIQGDARYIPLGDATVQCVVTSPPYWGLRDYHVSGQLGLEPTPEGYTANLVEVMREVRRVLRDDGTVWLNLGDSYAAQGGGKKAGQYEGIGHVNSPQAEGTCDERPRTPPAGLKPKDLIGIPWRVAFALQADGWYLRSDIIWAKPNPMPESIKDRPTKAHEYVFLLTKQERYYYDAEAVKELSTGKTGMAANFARATKDADVPGQGHHQHRLNRKPTTDNGKRNRRTVWKADADVWELATQPYKGAHFATFPERLVEPCVLAGCPENGLVLDPFAGSGTVGVVCDRLGRRFVGLELSLEYIKLAHERRAKATCSLSPLNAKAAPSTSMGAASSLTA